MSTSSTEKTPLASALVSFPAISLLALGMSLTAGHSSANEISWALDRIDQRSDTLDGQFSSAFDGSGVNIYLINTGVRTSHQAFGQRAQYASANDNDVCGDGTFTAGLIAGEEYGVATGANIIAFSDYDCRGYIRPDTLIERLNWIAEHGERPAVVHIGQAIAANPAVDAAVEAVINAGISVVSSSGDFEGYACDYSPARLDPVITVGAINRHSKELGSAGIGRCVDIYAPGTQLISAAIDSDQASKTLSVGSNHASAFVAGTLALYLQENNALTPAQLKAQLLTRASSNFVSGFRIGSGNVYDHILYSGNNKFLFTGDDDSASCESTMDNDLYCSAAARNSRPAAHHRYLTSLAAGDVFTDTLNRDRQRYFRIQVPEGAELLTVDYQHSYNIHYDIYPQSVMHSDGLEQNDALKNRGNPLSSGFYIGHNEIPSIRRYAGLANKQRLIYGFNCGFDNSHTCRFENPAAGDYFIVAYGGPFGSFLPYTLSYSLTLANSDNTAGADSIDEPNNQHTTDHNLPSPELVIPDNLAANKDSYVRGGRYSQRNFGRGSLIVKQSHNPSYTRHAFIGFDAAKIAENQHKSLRTILNVFVRRMNGDAALAISNSIGDWQESRLNWNNQPDAGTAEVHTNISKQQRGQWLQIDVTELVAAGDFNGSFKLSLNNNRYLSLNAKGSAHAPFLSWQKNNDELIVAK